MAWRSKTGPVAAANEGIENILGASLVVRGELKAEGPFRIDGTIEGVVESKGAVVIGERGVVRGEVRGQDVVVAGQIHGNVFARGHLDITASGRIEGDIEAMSVRVETGGVFRGTSRMGAEREAVAAEPAAATPSSRLVTVP